MTTTWTTSHAAAAPPLPRALPQDCAISRSALSAGVALASDSCSLARAVGRLRAGEGLRGLTVGASIAFGQGVSEHYGPENTFSGRIPNALRARGYVNGTHVVHNRGARGLDICGFAREMRSVLAWISHYDADVLIVPRHTAPPDQPLHPSSRTPRPILFRHDPPLMLFQATTT